jgi:hypothetical protein
MSLLVSHILGITALLNEIHTLHIACVLHSFYLQSTQTNYSTHYLNLHTKSLFLSLSLSLSLSLYIYIYIYIFFQRLFSTSYKYLQSILKQLYPILHIFTFKWRAIVLCSLHWLPDLRDWRNEPGEELTQGTLNMGLYSTHIVLTMFCYIVLCRYEHSDLQLKHCSFMLNHKLLSNA